MSRTLGVLQLSNPASVDRLLAKVWKTILPSTVTSPTLLERLRTSPDEASWSRFVDLYAPFIYQRLREYGLQDHDARDLAQDVLLAVFREMPQFHYEPHRGRFRGWLRTVVRNRLLGYWRQRRNGAAQLGTGDPATMLDQLADPQSEVSRAWDREHDSQIGRRVLKLLQVEFEPNTWQAFWRVVVENEQPADVAATLNMSSNAVYLAKSRVLRRLREESQGLLN